MIEAHLSEAARKKPDYIVVMAFTMSELVRMKHSSTFLRSTLATIPIMDLEQAKQRLTLELLASMALAMGEPDAQTSQAKCQTVNSDSQPSSEESSSTAGA